MHANAISVADELLVREVTGFTDSYTVTCK